MEHSVIPKGAGENSPVERNLDGIYFRVKRGEEFKSICFSDMTLEERAVVLQGRSTEWLISMCNVLAEVIHRIGDECDIEAVPVGEGLEEQ